MRLSDSSSWIEEITYIRFVDCRGTIISIVPDTMNQTPSIRRSYLFLSFITRRRIVMSTSESNEVLEFDSR